MFMVLNDIYIFLDIKNCHIRSSSDECLQPPLSDKELTAPNFTCFIILSYAYMLSSRFGKLVLFERAIFDKQLESGWGRTKTERYF